jgi:ubiquinone/menaquinone biosynthesis C-methylase UbiE
MAQETWGHNRRAIKALDLQPTDRVLDIGCGPGRSIEALAALAQSGHVVGVDPSALMVDTAKRRNRALVAAGRADIVNASVASLPFDDGVFDNALCVHVVYFWNDLYAAFCEIARVIKPGGRLVLLFRTDADEAAVRAFPAEVYRFHSVGDIIAPLEAAGFAVEAHTGLGPLGASPALLTAIKRSAQIASADAGRFSEAPASKPRKRSIS